MENTETIKASDIIMDDTDIQETQNMESDDSDMPAPDTMEYTDEKSRTLKPTYLFMKLFQQCTDRMPYASILHNSKGDQIKLMDLVRFVESKADNGMLVSEMDTIISFLAPCRKEHVRDLMEIIESKDLQSSLWTIL